MILTSFATRNSTVFNTEEVGLCYRNVWDYAFRVAVVAIPPEAA